MYVYIYTYIGDDTDGLDIFPSNTLQWLLHHRIQQFSLPRKCPHDSPMN